MKLCSNGGDHPLDERTEKAGGEVCFDCSTKNHENPNWVDEIQFVRFIAEAEAAGAFGGTMVEEIAKSMDLWPAEVLEIIDRAQAQWDDIKART